jgi:hypothetical protein
MEQAKKFGTLGLATGVHYGERQRILVPNATEELLGLHASGALAFAVAMVLMDRNSCWERTNLERTLGLRALTAFICSGDNLRASSRHGHRRLPFFETAHQPNMHDNPFFV